MSGAFTFKPRQNETKWRSCIVIRARVIVSVVFSIARFQGIEPMAEYLIRGGDVAIRIRFSTIGSTP